jgi:hypothetical protein
VIEIIEHADAGSGNGNFVRVGDSQSQVSLTVYQDIYHQVTGRTEQVRKRYSDNLLVDFGELDQLNHKILQLCDVHNVVARNESVSVFHEKDRKEQFTSFERFRAYNANTAIPTVSIVLRYNFSIVPAGRERPQEYMVSIRLNSRVAAIKQMENDAPPFMRGRGRFFGFMAGLTAEVTIDYADYVIARGFLEAFDEWVTGCKVTPNRKYIHALQRHSHRIPEVAQLLIASIVIYFGLQSVPQYFNEQTTPGTWARFFIVFSGGSYVLITLVSQTAELIETAIDSFPEMAYLKLNKGDEKLIDEAKGAEPRAWLHGGFGAVSSIILGIISSKLERFL